MVRPLASRSAFVRRLLAPSAAGSGRIAAFGAGDRDMAGDHGPGRPTPGAGPGRARRGAALAGLLLLGAGCAHREREPLSADRVDRDRVAREAVLEAIEQDHAALAALIASDRFDQPKAIYSNPDLRALALHLMEQTRRLRNLADTDVLAPGRP
ncbi:MAG: hypothetical protein R3F35_14105 [Myxococcota bacterium]